MKGLGAMAVSHFGVMLARLIREGVEVYPAAIACLPATVASLTVYALLLATTMAPSNPKPNAAVSAGLNSTGSVDPNLDSNLGPNLSALDEMLATMAGRGGRDAEAAVTLARMMGVSPNMPGSLDGGRGWDIHT